MKRALRIITSVAFTLLFGIKALAADDSTIIDLSSSVYTAETQPTWIDDEYGRKYVDATGNALIGYFFDTHGDFYSSDDKGYIRKIYVDSQGREFGADGKLINTGYVRVTKDFTDLAKKAENCEQIEFKSKSRALDFIEYYGKQYSYDRKTENFRLKRDRKTGVYFLESSNDIRGSSNKDKAVIDDNFNMDIQGETLLNKLEFVYNKLSTYEYSSADINTQLSKAIQAKKFGCWHYSKIANYILNKNGIQSEIVTGISYGVPHMWLRVKDELGNWIYTDPTYYNTGWKQYLNIDYKIYKDNYIPHKYFY